MEAAVRATEGLVAADSAREMVVATATETVGSARVVKMAATAAVASATEGWMALGWARAAAARAVVRVDAERPVAAKVGSSPEPNRPSHSQQRQKHYRWSPTRSESTACWHRTRRMRAAE